MKRLVQWLGAVFTSRFTPPLVMGVFLLFYIGVAFFTEDALVMLIALTKHNLPLALLFAVLPLNYAVRTVIETRQHLARRRALGNAVPASPELYDETVQLQSAAAPAGLEGRLREAGYSTATREGGLAAWRGVSAFPARLLYLAGTFCLFAGILISLTTRTSTRTTVVEGEPLFEEAGQAQVERIVLAEGKGAILAKTLDIVLARPGGSSKSYGLYPPSRYQGGFVYPRYLGVGLQLRFSAPDLQPGYEKACALNVLPVGKEAKEPIPDSPYRLVLSLAEPQDGSDPYMTGRFVYLFKLYKDKEQVLSGSAPTGGEFVKDGYRLQFLDSRRLVITDFISDYGVTLIWIAFLLFLAALSYWLPVRLFLPRREMVISGAPGSIVGCSRAEGKQRSHAGIFQESLDLLGGREEQ
jgi:hypothetical protein